MATISHEIRISASVASVYDALTTNRGMQGWHTAVVEGDGTPGSNWVLDFPGKAGFTWEITKQVADSDVEWRCVAGPGDSVGTTVGYKISDAGDGRTLLVITHSGWPDENGNFRKCNTLWGVLAHHLQQYVETGTRAPAFS